MSFSNLPGPVRGFEREEKISEEEERREGRRKVRNKDEKLFNTWIKLKSFHCSFLLIEEQGKKFFTF